jgi:type IV secretory pathway protease TraF
MRFILIGALAFAVGLPAAIQRSGLLMNYGFCLPGTTANAAIHAGLEVVPGTCPSGLAPVLKPLTLASAEHPISLTERGFFIDGKLLANTAPKSRSRTGVALEHYPFGVYTNGLWAVSDFNANSYDSRYFGPVAPDAIRFYAKPVWTW